MAKKIRKEDLFDGDPLASFRKSAVDTEASIKSLEDTLENLKALSDAITQQESENQRKTKKDIDARLAAEKQRLKIEQTVIQTKKLLTKEYDDQAKATAKAALVAQQATAQAKKQFEAQKALNSEYKKGVLQLNSLKKSLKELEFTGRTNGKLYKALSQEFQELDKKVRGAENSVGEFGRNVGEYSNAIREALGSSKLFGGITGEISEKLRGLRAVLLATKNEAKGGLNLAKALGTTVVLLALTAVIAAMDHLSKTTAQGESALAGLSATGEVFAQRFTSLGKLIAQVATGGSIDDLTKSWEGFIGKGEESVSVIYELGKANKFFELWTEKVIAGLEKENSLLQTQKALSNQIANDETVGFATRQAALDAEAESQEKILKNEKTIAESRLLVAQDSLKLAEKSKLGDQIIFDEKKKVMVAEIALEEADRNIKLDNYSIQERKRKLTQDELILDLELIRSKRKSSTEQHDILLRDANDNKKQFDERVGYAHKLLEVNKKTFDEQIAMFKKGTGSKFDEGKLLGEKDNISLERKIKNLNLSEALTSELAVIIKKTQEAELEGNNEINKIEEERIKNLEDIYKIEQEILELKSQHELDVIKQSADQQEEIYKTLNENILKDENAFNEKMLADRENTSKKINELIIMENMLREQQLRDKEKADEVEANNTITDTDKLNATIIKLQQKLNNDLGTLDDEEKKKLTQATKEKIKEDEAITAKQLEIASEVGGKILDSIEKVGQEVSQKKQEQLDREISQRETNIERQQSLAERGLANTLAFEEKAKAQAELKKIQEAEVEKKRERAIAFLRLLAGYAEKDPSTALQKAALDIALSKIVEGSFWDGTENIAESLGKAPLKGRDGYVVRVDGSERVMTGKQNEMVGSLSNQELAQLAHDYNSGRYIPNYATQSPSAVLMGGGDSSALLIGINRLNQNMEGVRNSIENKKEMNVNWNSQGDAIVREVEAGISRTVKYIKRKPRI